MRKFKNFFLGFFLLLYPVFVYSQTDQSSQKRIPVYPELTVTQNDLSIERHYSPEGIFDGYLLYVRKLPAVESVMLCETAKDPEGKMDNFAYRASSYNSYNGDEIRILNGKVLDSEYARYTLISSTPVKHSRLGDSFCIFIPPVLVYGYPWSRNGTVTVGNNTFVNIRTFSKKYGDYEGNFQDNPFMFSFKTPAPEKTKPAVNETLPEKKSLPEPPVLDEKYNPDTAASFSEIAGDSGGNVIYSEGTDSLKKDVDSIIRQLDKSKKADLVFAIDTTGSMVDELNVIRTVWLPQFIKEYPSYTDLRVALVLYRDFGDSYLYKNLPVKIFHFTRDMKVFYRNIDGVYIKGNEGGDVPEAVYEALYASLKYLDWRDDAQKKIILIGDAPAHDIPRGPKKISREIVAELAASKGVSCDCIILP